MELANYSDLIFKILLLTVSFSFGFLNLYWYKRKFHSQLILVDEQTGFTYHSTKSNNDITKHSRAFGNETLGKFKSLKKDNLQLIEGITGKIEAILNKWGIGTFKKLSMTSPGDLKSILVKEAGNKNVPESLDTWPVQASIVAVGQMEDLIRFQNKLTQKLNKKSENQTSNKV